jgi:hypothetical protein
VKRGANAKSGKEATHFMYGFATEDTIELSELIRAKVEPTKVPRIKPKYAALLVQKKAETVSLFANISGAESTISEGFPIKNPSSGLLVTE